MSILEYLEESHSTNFLSFNTSPHTQDSISGAWTNEGFPNRAYITWAFFQLLSGLVG